MRQGIVEKAPVVAPQHLKATSNYRWIIMGLAFFITIVNYMDRSAISYAIEPIKRDFHISDGAFGSIFAAFGIGYMVSTFVGGLLVDRWGAHRVWSGAAVAWSIMTAALGIAAGFWPLMLARTMLGITEGPSFPSLTRVVADWLPVSERVRATAFGLVAVPLASVIGAPLISSLILNLGWKVMFLVLGSLGVVWAAVWVVLFKDYPENSKHVSAGELQLIRGGSVLHQGQTCEQIRQTKRANGTTNIKAILKNPALLSNNYAFFAFGYLLFFAIHWLPEYMQHTFGIGLKEVGVLLIAPWLTAAVMLAGCGWLSDYLLRTTGSLRKSRSHLIWVCQLLSAICFIPVVMTHSLPVAVVFLSLGLGFGLAPNAAFYALNADIAHDRAGTSLGLMASSTAGAAILSPWITGILKDATGSFNSGIALLIFFTLTSVVAIVCFQHPDRYALKTDVS
jgi:ACS family hexuronate transporter-like MFS transporter